MATYITSDWYIADFLPSRIVQACAFPSMRERVHSAMILLHVKPGDIPNAVLGTASVRASAQAYVLACSDSFGMLGLISIVCIALVLWLRETPVSRPVRWMPNEGSAGR